MAYCVSPGPGTVSLFISSKLLLWSLEKDIIGRINIENGKKKAFMRGGVFVLVGE